MASCLFKHISTTSSQNIFNPLIGSLDTFERAKELKEVNLYAANHLFQKLLRSPSVVRNCLYIHAYSAFGEINLL